jgi:DNA-binding transcriptional ArsR family regulator
MELNSHPQLLPRVAERFAALSDANRLRILLRLKAGPCNVSALTDELKVAQASVSKHLSVLKKVGLVDVDRVGTQMVYRIHDKSVFDMCRIVCDGVVRHIKRESAVIENI